MWMLLSLRYSLLKNDLLFVSGNIFSQFTVLIVFIWGGIINKYFYQNRTTGHLVWFL